jgi:N-acetylmuramic acid 6-phosphate etherase
VESDATPLDLLTTEAVIQRLCTAEAQTATAVCAQRDAIARGAERIAAAIGSGGRLIYAGAGTSGRLGMLDAAEWPPTFGTSPRTVRAILAGGAAALTRAVEGAEDDEDDARRQLRRLRLSDKDVVCAIAASGVTPFALAALGEARRVGAGTLFVTCSHRRELARLADVLIAPQVGPEVLTGSTRLKAGTATKLVLNALSTAAMVRRGRVFDTYMVELQPTNRKLRDRAVRIVCAVAKVDAARAEVLLRRADWRVKLAIVMGARALSLPRAAAALERAGHDLRAALTAAPCPRTRTRV